MRPRLCERYHPLDGLETYGADHMWSLKSPTPIFARLTILAPVSWPNSNIGNYIPGNDTWASFIRFNIHCGKWLAPKGSELNSLHSQLGKN